MDKTLHYIFDPLCGWCYGASPALSVLAGSTQVDLKLVPSGLFSGAGARLMDDAFAKYAWDNDQRIERLTGQRFTDRYRRDVLADRQQLFDSGPATLALTAVAMTAPERELEVLKAIQHERYVDGQDITRRDALVILLKGMQLESAAALILAQLDAKLHVNTRTRIANAQAMLHQVGARGVPTFILETNGERRLLNSGAAFSNPRTFIEQIAAD